jgi:hypothetical protein
MPEARQSSRLSPEYRSVGGRLSRRARSQNPPTSVCNFSQPFLVHTIGLVAAPRHKSLSWLQLMDTHDPVHVVISLHAHCDVLRGVPLLALCVPRSDLPPLGAVVIAGAVCGSGSRPFADRHCLSQSRSMSRSISAWVVDATLAAKNTPPTTKLSATAAPLVESRCSCVVVALYLASLAFASAVHWLRAGSADAVSMPAALMQKATRKQ